ncbi:MAG: bifunctional serine/threonine protein kinase/MFS transporter [Gimesia sp.]|nr:bifunctional serine/threonine protein kinase/MFS transporter [Gimesia sp.]
MSDPDSSDNSEQTPEPTRENVNPQSIEGLFLIALDKKTPAERKQFLDETCGDDLERRRRVEALLLAYDDAGSFLEKSPIGAHETQPISLDFLTPSENPDLLGTLGEYEIQEVIGQGGMGIVFRALDPKLNRIVAIKVMSPLLAVNPNSRKRFLREAQAAAAVSHPHIVTIHAVDEDKLPYLVMEYVVGQSLQEKLDQTGALKVTEILRIGTQIADGLAAAHKQGLIHRDIKPANILLENGVERVKITDFGLARAVDDVTITKTGEVSGTPQYMSPEQATGERVDQRSDLFSLGAVLYAMCTGRSPFRASNLVAVVRRVCDDRPRPIQDVNEEIPEWMIEIIDCLLEKRPENRLQTASEVADLLGAHLAHVQQPGAVPPIERKPINQQIEASRKAALPVANLQVEASATMDAEDKQSGSLRSAASVELEKGGTPADYILGILLGLVLGTVIGLMMISPSTPESTMTYNVMSKIIKFSFTLIFILSIASIVYWNRSDKKPLPFLTWFLSTLAMFMTLGLSFITTALIRAAPLEAEFTSLHGSILAATVLGVLAVAGFAIRGQWVHISSKGPEYVAAVKQKDARTLTGTGIVIWIIMVLFYWMFSTGIYTPAFMANGDWHFTPILIFSLAGGMFVTVGLLLQRSLSSGGRVEEQHVAVTSPDVNGQHDARESGPQKTGRWVDRGAVWVGGLMLLIPFFIGLFGMATGRHFTGNVTEMVLVSLLFFGPVGLLVLVCGMQNLVHPESKSAKILDGLFLLVCFVLGPLGILLYIARHIKQKEARGAKQPEEKPVTPGADLIVQEHQRSNKRIVIGVLSGIAGLALLFFLAHAYRHLNTTEQHLVLSWGLKLFVVSGMFGLAYYIKRNSGFDALSNPWKSIGWLVLSAMIFIPSLFAVSLLVPKFARMSGSDEVVIDYDEQYPITIVSTKSDTDDIQAYPVHSRPFKLRLTPGKHALRISYSASGYVYSFTKNVKKIAGKQLRINLRPDIQRFVNDDKKMKQDESVERRKNRGAILLSGQTPGLRVGVFPVDSSKTRMDDGVFGFADRFFVLEPMTYEVPAGTYEIKVSSPNAGWVVDGRQPQYLHSKIEVKPGAIVPVTIQSDYTKIAESHPDWSKGGLIKFHWPVPRMGAHFIVYTLTVPQAEVVQELLAAFVAGKPGVNELDLVETANKHIITKSYASMKNLFNNGKHPAWEKLIVPGKGENTWRLSEPELKTPQTKNRNGTRLLHKNEKLNVNTRKDMGILLFSGRDPGVQIEVQRVGTGPDQADEVRDYLSKKTSAGKWVYELSAVEYNVEVISDLAGWEYKASTPRYLHSKIKVKSKKVIEQKISIDFLKLAKNHPFKINEAKDLAMEGVTEFKFYWPDPKSNKRMIYTYSAPQAQVVQKLFQSFAEKKPDVSETNLLELVNQDKKTKNYKSLSDLFKNNKNPAWRSLIIPGKAEGSWRLAEPNVFTPKSRRS